MHAATEAVRYTFSAYNSFYVKRMLPERLQLTRPLVFFDIESTGLSLTHARIVELCGIKIFPDRTREEFFQRFNPGIPIPPDATAVHGITNEMVAHEPTF